MGASSSVARRPGVKAIPVPEVTIKGRSEPASAEPSASMARLSISQFAANFEKSWLKARVNHAIRHGCSTAQAFQVFKIASMHLGTGSDERLGARIRASKTEHLMARVD